MSSHHERDVYQKGINLRNKSLHAQKKERHTVARVHRDISKRADWIVALMAGSSFNAFTLVEQLVSPREVLKTLLGEELASEMAALGRQSNSISRKYVMPSAVGLPISSPYVFRKRNSGFATLVCDATSQGSVKTDRIDPYMARTLNASKRVGVVSITMPVMRLETQTSQQGPPRVGQHEERIEHGLHQEL